MIKPDVTNPGILTEINLFYVRNDRGDFIPMRVESSKVAEKANKFTFFVKFEQITDKNGVDELKNRSVFVTTDDFESLNQFIEETHIDFTDFNLVSENGDDYGIIIDVIDNPAHPIFEVTGPKGHYMVPYVEEYIAGYDLLKHCVIGKNIDRLLNI